MLFENLLILNILLVVFLFVIPPLLFYYNIIGYRYRLFALGLIAIIAVHIMFVENWSLHDMGLRLDNFVPSIIPYIIFTIVGSFIIILLSILILKRKHIVHWWTNRHLVLLFVPISFLQELLFRAFLMPILHNIFTSVFIVVLVNAFLFMLIHIIYKHNYIDLLLVFVEGILLATMYLYYPNIILIGLAHSAHNFIAEYFNFFNQSKYK